MKTNSSIPAYPKGCTITNIRQSKWNRSIYAQLRGPEGELLISATLDYINKALSEYGVEE